jgi:hypothetical protein
VDETEIEGDFRSVDGVVVTCSRCGASSESFGTSPASVRRCLVLLREQCDEANFYYAENEEDQE